MPEKVFIRNVPDDLWRAVKARASLEGITISEAVQRALRGYLAGVSGGDGSRDHWHGMIGLFGGDEPDVAEHHDLYLAEEPAPYRSVKKSRRKKKK
jgi:hypothetical protein